MKSETEGPKSGPLLAEIALSDARLMKLIEAWPTLPDEVKDEILSLVAGVPACPVERA